MSSLSQNREILAYLRNGGSITSLEAIDKFGCARLASRIEELRKAGHDVKDAWVHHNEKRFKRYYLPSPRLQAIQATAPMKPKAEQSNSLF